MRPPVHSVVQLAPFGRRLSTPAGRFQLEASRSLSAARTLEAHHPKNETPHYIVLFHAIELGLKAFLIKHGIEVKALEKRPYRHDLSALYKEAVRHGLSLSDPNAAGLIDWINEWHEKPKLRYDFDTVRELPTCAVLAPLAEAIIEASR
jgi:HEPN domain-containing protein